jgi:methylenetetrahydrofolate dehydrogenase (NADP+) / methenyltetrahydrofolate cyclohydrolase
LFRTWSEKVDLPDSTDTEQLFAAIDGLNADPDMHGILLQHPAPKQIDERQCFDRIALLLILPYTLLR